MTNSETPDYLSEIRRAMNLLNANSVPEAIETCQNLAALEPDRAEAYFVLGGAAYLLGDLGRAIELIETAHKLDPDCRDYVDALATTYTKAGKLTDGLFFAKLATALSPHSEVQNFCPPVLQHYHNALHTVAPSGNFLTASRAYNNRDWDGAIDAAAKELRLNSTHIEAQRLLGRALMNSGNHSRATAAFQTCVHMKPDSAIDAALLGQSLVNEGRFLEAHASLLRAAKLGAKDPAVFAIVLNAIVYLPGKLAADFKPQANAWRRAMEVDRIEAGFEPEGKTKIRIGYITDSCRNGPHVNLLRALLLFHNTDQFEIYVYQNFPIKDSATTPFESASASWRELHDVDDETAAYIMAADELDILVDLNLEPENQRHHLLAMRPGKVQISWIGAPEAAGWPGIDVLLTDSVLEAADTKAITKTQSCYKLRGGLVAHEYPQGLPEPDLPAIVNGHITYGGILDFATLQAQTAAIWSTILDAAPNSVLLLGSEKPITDEIRAQAMDLFANFGMADRVRFCDPVPEDDERIQANGLVSLFAASDILLDSAPISNADALVDALWMGLPVVTLIGKTRASALGASIVTAANRAEWATKSEKSYVAMAVKLGSSTESLAQLRDGIRESNRKSALFNPPVFARTVESAYRSIMADMSRRAS